MNVDHNLNKRLSVLEATERDFNEIRDNLRKIQIRKLEMLKFSNNRGIYILFLLHYLDDLNYFRK